MGRLLALDMLEDEKGQPQPVDISLTPQGKQAWIAFYNAHAVEQAEMTGELAAAWSKLEGYAARFALLVHLIRAESSDTTLADVGAVDEQSIAAGVALSRWFGDEAARVYGIIGGDTENPRSGSSESCCGSSGSAAGKSPCGELMHACRRYRESAKEAEAALRLAGGNENPRSLGGRTRFQRWAAGRSFSRSGTPVAVTQLAITPRKTGLWFRYQLATAKKHGRG